MLAGNRAGRNTESQAGYTLWMLSGMKNEKNFFNKNFITHTKEKLKNVCNFGHGPG